MIERVKVLQEDEPLLRQASLHVVDFGAELQQLCELMRRAAHEFDEDNRVTQLACGGLAAVQIGVPLQVVLIRFGGEQFLINPVIVRRSPTDQLVLDGCLSVKRSTYRVHTARPAQLVVEFQDREGNRKCAAFKGLKAAIVHHELDHLDGKLFTDLVKEQAA